eukprot:scaffold499_cov335-Pavlova_lutheri.AAC.19
MPSKVGGADAGNHAATSRDLLVLQAPSSCTKWSNDPRLKAVPKARCKTWLRLFQCHRDTLLCQLSSEFRTPFCSLVGPCHRLARRTGRLSTHLRVLRALHVLCPDREPFPFLWVASCTAPVRRSGHADRPGAESTCADAMDAVPDAKARWCVPVRLSTLSPCAVRSSNPSIRDHGLRDVFPPSSRGIPCHSLPKKECHHIRERRTVAYHDASFVLGHPGAREGTDPRRLPFGRCRARRRLSRSDVSR